MTPRFKFVVFVKINERKIDRVRSGYEPELVNVRPAVSGLNRLGGRPGNPRIIAPLVSITGTSV